MASSAFIALWGRALSVVAWAPGRRSARGPGPARGPLDRPGVELERPLPPGGQGRVQHVERVEGLDPFDQVVLSEAVQGPHRESAGVDVGAFLEKGLDLVVDGEVTREGLLADRGVAAGAGGEEHPRPVEDDVDVEALPDQAGRRQQVHQGDRPLVGDGVDEDVGLLPRLRLDVLEDLLLRVVEKLPGLRLRGLDRLRHRARLLSGTVISRWWSR